MPFKPDTAVTKLNAKLNTKKLKKNSDAAKIGFTKPLDFEMLYQVDKKLYVPINKFGCRYMSMISIPQIVCRKKLSSDAINYIYDQAVDGNLGPNVMNKSCTCGENEDMLINKAFEILGYPGKTCRQVWVSDNKDAHTSPQDLPEADDKPMFIVVDFNTRSNAEYGGHHFVLFNAIGDLLYDPGKNTVKSFESMHRWLVYKVFS